MITARTSAVEVEVEIIPISKVLIVQEGIAVEKLVKVYSASRIEVVLASSGCGIRITTQSWDSTRWTQRTEHFAEFVNPGCLLTLYSLQFGKVICVAANLVERRRGHGRGAHDGRERGRFRRR